MTNFKSTGALGITTSIPRRVPDLFVGRPVMIFGRFTGTRPATITVSGRSGDGAALDRADASIPTAPESQHAAIASVWARLKIADLEDNDTRAGTASDGAAADQERGARSTA